MQRIDSATAVANTNGTGKTGFVAGTLPGTPPTQMTPKFCNQVQEEICNVIEVTKATALSTSQTQLRDALLARFRSSAVRGLKPHRNYDVDVSLDDIIWTEELQAFVAVGSGSAFRSTDGATWSEATGMVAGTFRSIAFSPSLERFIAIGNAGVIRQSVDEGSSWDAVTTPPAANNWSSVCWSPALSLFVAVASSGTDRVATSPTGMVWTARSAAQANSWRSVCWSPELSLFVAVSDSGTDRVMTSPDGITWTARTTSTLGLWSSVAWSPTLGRFCAVADDVSGNMVMTSTDGSTWTFNFISTPDNWYKKIIWVPDLLCFVACASQSTNDGVAGGGSDTPILWSIDGTTWLTASAGVENYLSCIAWSPSLQAFCGGGANSTDAAINIFVGP